MFATIISFLLLTVPALFTPGPNNLMLLTSTAKFGVRRTIPHGAGVVLGFCLMTFVLGFGVAEVLNRLPWLHQTMKYAAAIYFIWMAYRLLGLKLDKDTEITGRPMRTTEAMLFQWINPKALVIGPSFVAAFIQEGDARLPSLLIIVAGCFCVSCSSTITWMIFGERLKAGLIALGMERYLGYILAGLMGIAVLLFVFG